MKKLTLERINKIFEEYNTQKVDQPNFAYDFKNLKVMIDGYWSTDCVSGMLSMETYMLKTEEHLKELLSECKQSVTFNALHRAIMIQEDVNGDEVFSIRMARISEDKINSVLSASEGKTQQEKANVVYFYSPSSKL